MNSVEAFLPSEPRRPSSPNAKGPPRVLLVEDEASIRVSVSALLAEEGFDVKTADGGRSALRYLQQTMAGLPDVVILDLRMPDMDGWQFRLEQKQDGRLAEIPVLAVSADQTPQARAVDATAFLPKPFSLDDLVWSLRRILSTRTEFSGPALASPASLAAGIAHEISSPLCCVMGNLDLAVARLDHLSGEPAAEVRSLLEGAAAGTERIRTILSELRWTKSKGAVAGTDVVAVVRLVLRMMTSEIRRRGNVETWYHPVPPVTIPRPHLERVVTNLVANACLAMDVGQSSGNLLRVRVENGPPGLVIIRVADTGGGIPPSLREKIFEPFFTTRNPSEGTGLGLSICRALVREVGGDLGFQNLDQGTEFFVTLPTAQSEPEKTS